MMLSNQKPIDPAPRGRVILLHGLAAHRWFTALLAARLRRNGYRVECWGYNAFSSTLDQLIPHFHEQLRELHNRLDDGEPVFLVGHSLGAIILRGALAGLDLPSLRRMVLLAPPNAGSRVAFHFGPWLKWISPLVEELSDREESRVRRLSRELPAGVEVGTIAAQWDALVHLDSTRLGSEQDHIILPSLHSGLLYRREAAVQVVHFLEHGRFQREGCPMTTPASAAANP